MTEPVLDDIFARLDMVVLERHPDGPIARVGSASPPEWFNRVSAVREGDDVQALPFLANFLVDAEQFWRGGGEGRLRSDPVMVTDASGTEVPLIVNAVGVGERRFLILELPFEFEERRRTLQSARELALARDAHVRNTRTLLGAVDAARRLAHQLVAGELTSEQQQLARGISEQLASLSASLEALVPLPRGVSRR